MKLTRRLFFQQAFAAGTLLVPGILAAAPVLLKNENMRIRLLRHATLLLEINGKTILVDPMLSKKEAMDPVGNAANRLRIPMVDFPLTDSEMQSLLAKTDGVIITHTHRDHWDVAAQEMIGKQTQIFCQPADEAKIRSQGFTNVTVIDTHTSWNNILLTRTNGQHGTGEIGKSMGTVSGFVIAYNGQRVYIAGDTIYCSDVEEAISKHSPTHVIVNGGAAQFVSGDPITMTTNDVLAVSKITKVKITVVHLETVNHCLQKRPAFELMKKENDLSDRVLIPADGEWIKL
jgi:L-ascorbate metabolism protein UlaG (beta-lactamase superfamily)